MCFYLVFHLLVRNNILNCDVFVEISSPAPQSLLYSVNICVIHTVDFVNAF